MCFKTVKIPLKRRWFGSKPRVTNLWFSFPPVPSGDVQRVDIWPLDYLRHTSGRTSFTNFSFSLDFRQIQMFSSRFLCMKSATGFISQATTSNWYGGVSSLSTGPRSQRIIHVHKRKTIPLDLKRCTLLVDSRVFANQPYLQLLNGPLDHSSSFNCILKLEHAPMGQKMLCD